MKSLRAVRVRLLHDEHGAALVEFALVAVLILMLIFGIIDFGRALYLKNNLTNAAREGGRIAAVQMTPDSVAVRIHVDSVIMDIVNDSLRAHTVKVDFLPSAAALQSIKVSISYPYEPLTPVAGLIGLGNLTLRASAQFRYELGAPSA